MSLMLRVVRYRGAAPARPVSVSVNQQPVIIGRRPDCDLLLADPEHFISNQHACVTWNNADSGYYLADTSTNGTHVNHAEAPVGRNNSVKLNDGDEISIGDYELQVCISATGAPEVATIPPAPQNPFDSVAPASPEMGMAPPAPAAPPPSMPEEPLWEGSEPLDPLQLIDAPADPFSAPNTNPPAWPEARYEPSSEVPDFDMVGGLPPTNSTAQSGSVPDNTPSDQAYFSPPQVIPEDWDILEESSAEPPPPAQSIGPPIPPAADAPAPASPAASIAPSAGDAEAVHALLAGLGLEKIRLSSAETTELMHLVGELLREMTTGVMRILVNRANLKNQMRMNMTTIKAAENNPLKFSTGAEDALNRLLVNPGQGYLPPREAVREAIGDLQVHEMALMAGLRAALEAQFARFAPEQLEKSASRKAKCWELFTQRYKEMRAQAEDDPLRLSGDAFIEAYEAQARQIKATRGKDEA